MSANKRLHIKFKLYTTDNYHTTSDNTSKISA